MTRPVPRFAGFERDGRHGLRARFLVDVDGRTLRVSATVAGTGQVLDVQVAIDGRRITTMPLSPAGDGKLSVAGAAAIGAVSSGSILEYRTPVGDVVQRGTFQ